MMFITVKAQKEGLHCWPEAPDEVFFLRDMHRHVFHVEAEIRVYADDRELEFFIVQKRLRRILDEIFDERDGSISCEKIARRVQTELVRAFPGSGWGEPLRILERRVNVRVSEDGENGVYLKSSS